MLQRLLLLLVGLVFLAGPAAAQDAEVPPAEAHALALADAHGTDGFAELANGASFDPWLVAELLCMHEAFDAATALAGLDAGGTPEPTALQRYVQRRRSEGAGAAAEEWDTLFGLMKLREAGRTADAAKLLEDGPVPGETVLGVELHRGRARVSEDRRDLRSGVVANLAAADVAAAIGWRRKEAESLRDAARLQLYTADLTGMEGSARRALAVDLALGDAAGAAASRQQIATALTQMGRAAEARSIAAEAVAHYEAHDASASQVLALVTLLIADRALGNVAEAIESGERAVAVAETVGHPDHVGLALSNVATVYADAGLIERSDQCLRRQLELIAPDQIDTRVQALSNLGWGLHQLGRPAEALSTLADAVELSAGCTRPYVPVQVRQNLAAVDPHLGRSEEAERLFREAVEFAGRAGMLGYRAFLQVGLARELVRLDRRDEAVEVLQEARRAAEQVGDWATAGNAVGLLAEYGGDAADAIAAHEKALAYGRRAQNAYLIAVARNALILAKLDAADAEGALVLADEAVVEATASELTQQRYNAHLARSLVRAALGEHEAALEDADRAMELQVRVLAGLGDEESGQVASGLARGLRIAVRLAHEAEDARRLLHYTELLRAASLAAVLDDRKRMTTRRVPAELRQREASARKQLALAEQALAQALAAKQLKEIRTAKAELEQALTRLRDVVADVRRRSRLAAGVTHPDPRSLDELRAALRPDQAAVVYSASAEGLSSVGRRVLALVVTADGERVVDLGLDEDVGLDVDPDELVADPELLATLRARILDPLGLGAEVREVVVSPVGQLAYVPFAALDAERSFVHTPSMTVYLEFLDAAQAPGSSVLAVADPIYGGDDDATHRGRSTLRGLRFALSPLPGTRDEALAIADESLLGEEATEAGLRARLERIEDGERLRALHFACHGLLDSEYPLMSALALTADDSSDGNLTALEIGNLTAPADLVALSACETARGKIYSGTGVVGFTTTFMAAGADRVLCSLWKVDDAATAALMKRFYALWNHDDPEQRVPAGEALRRAQEHVRGHEEWKDPIYWAAWQLWGLGD